MTRETVGGNKPIFPANLKIQFFVVDWGRVSEEMDRERERVREKERYLAIGANRGGCPTRNTLDMKRLRGG